MKKIGIALYILTIPNTWKGFPLSESIRTLGLVKRKKNRYALVDGIKKSPKEQPKMLNSDDIQINKRRDLNN